MTTLRKKHGSSVSEKRGGVFSAVQSSALPHFRLLVAKNEKEIVLAPQNIDRPKGEPTHCRNSTKMALQRLQVDPATMNKEKQHENASDSESQASNVQKKRRRENKDDDDDIILSPEILAKMSRSERKRHREKKRRSDVNKGFDDLMNLLLEIDPVVRAEAEDRARRGQWKGNLGAQEDNLLSRVELIGRTVDVLRRVHKENEERKQIIEKLLQQKPTTTTAPAPAPHAFHVSLNQVSLPLLLQRSTQLAWNCV